MKFTSIGAYSYRFLILTFITCRKFFRKTAMVQSSIANSSLKPGNLKDPELAELFSQAKDFELNDRYEERREIGHGAFGSVYYVMPIFRI